MHKKSSFQRVETVCESTVITTSSYRLLSSTRMSIFQRGQMRGGHVYQRQLATVTAATASGGRSRSPTPPLPHVSASSGRSRSPAPSPLVGTTVNDPYHHIIMARIRQSFVAVSRIVTCSFNDANLVTPLDHNTINLSPRFEVSNLLRRAASTSSHHDVWSRWLRHVSSRMDGNESISRLQYAQVSDMPNAVQEQRHATLRRVATVDEAHVGVGARAM